MDICLRTCIYIATHKLAFFVILITVCLVDIECPAGMVYQQCGQACPQTCDTVESEDCVGGCVEGCFCPSDMVLWKGRCISVTECAGTYIHTYVPM